MRDAQCLNAPTPSHTEGEKKNDLNEQQAKPIQNYAIQNNASTQVVAEPRLEKTTNKPLTNIASLTPKTGFSLRNSINAVPEQKATQQNEVEQKTELLIDKDLNLEEVRSVIFAYAEEKFKSANKMLYSTLISQQAEIAEQVGIVIPVLNEAQSESFKEHSQSFLEHLRVTLSNKKITLKFLEKETKREEKKLYSPKEKFHHLVSKNAMVMELSKRLNLELDF